MYILLAQTIPENEIAFPLNINHLTEKTNDNGTDAKPKEKSLSRTRGLEREGYSG